MATVIAKNTVRVAGTGPRVMVVKGKTYDSDDPIVVEHSWLFTEPDEFARQETKPTSTDDLGKRSMSARHLHRQVETATQAPGEVRDGHVCDVCGESAKTKAGLAAHRRSHNK